MLSFSEMTKEEIWQNSAAMKLPGKGTLVYRGDRLVVELDSDLTAYYRYLIGARQYLIKPSFGSHITVSVGVDASAYHEREVEFEYSHFVRISGDTTGSDRPDSYYFLDVWSDELVDIRTHLGLETNFKFHITIGRLHYRG